MRTQLLRYTVVGLVSNGLLYLAYLLITYFGVGHKTTMTLLYCVGIAQTYLFNRKWTFGHNGSTIKAFPRYVGAYAIGYLFNLIALYISVDVIGLPHQVVQGVLLFIVAVLIFLLQKYWVFCNTNTALQGQTNKT